MKSENGSSEIKLYKERQFSDGSFSKLFFVCKSLECGYGTVPESLSLNLKDKSFRHTVGGSAIKFGILQTEHQDLLQSLYEDSEETNEIVGTILTEFQGHPFVYIKDFVIDSYRPHLQDEIIIALNNDQIIVRTIESMSSNQHTRNRQNWELMD